MNTLARLVVQRAQAQWRELDEHIDWCDERIGAHAKANDAVMTRGEAFDARHVSVKPAVPLSTAAPG